MRGTGAAALLLAGGLVAFACNASFAFDPIGTGGGGGLAGQFGNQGGLPAAGDGSGDSTGTSGAANASSGGASGTVGTAGTGLGGTTGTAGTPPGTSGTAGKGGGSGGTGGVAGKGGTSGTGGAGGRAGTGGVSGTGGADCATRCPAAGLVCVTAWATCGECNADTDCGAEHCDTNAASLTFHRCVACVANAQCGSAYVCPISNEAGSPTAHQCAQICSDANNPCASGDCDSSGFCRTCDDGPPVTGCPPARPHCIDHLTCGACAVDSDCAVGQHCDPAGFNCVACRDSRDCLTNQVCDKATHVCR